MRSPLQTKQSRPGADLIYNSGTASSGNQGERVLNNLFTNFERSGVQPYERLAAVGRFCFGKGFFEDGKAVLEKVFFLDKNYR